MSTRQNLSIEYLGVSQLRPFANNARTHSKKQVRQIADSIKAFGFTNQVLIDDAGTVLAGHGRVAAAKLLGMKQVPLRAAFGNDQQPEAGLRACRQQIGPQCRLGRRAPGHRA